jgi:tetratricopeptide (TPR) repeat protein
MRKQHRLLVAALVSLMACWPLSFTAQTPSPRKTEQLKRADVAFHAGYDALQSGNLELARAKFAEASHLAPRIPEAHEALGAVLVELGRPAEAVEELEAASKLKPGDQGIETNLALAYVKADLNAKAIPHFSAAFNLSQQSGHPPADGAFCEAYARALAATGKLTEAIEMFRAASKRGGARADIWDAIGSLDAQLGKWDEARSQFELALTTDSSCVLARIHLGVLLLHERDFPAAVDALEKAVKQEPANALAQFEYGRALEAVGQDDVAVPCLQEAVKLNPELAEAPNELAMALQRLGRQQEAVPWFQKAIEREPHNVSALTNLGLALTMTGKAKESLEIFHLALAETTKDAVIYKDMGVAHVQLSAFDEAISDFRAAMAIDPNDPQIHYDLGLAYKFKDRANDAIAELTRAGELDPTLPDPPYTLGILYMQIGRLDLAAIELKRAVTLRPDNGDAWAILGSTLKQDSRLDEARDALEKAISLLLGQPGPRVTLAALLAEQAGLATTAADASEAAGEQQKADQERRHAKELRSQAAEYRRQAAELSRAAVNRQKASFALNAGNQLLLRGQIADAVARYQESIAADPTFADAHSQLAIAYERQGRIDEATTERAKAKDLVVAQ